MTKLSFFLMALTAIHKTNHYNIINLRRSMMWESTSKETEEWAPARWLVKFS